MRVRNWEDFVEFDADGRMSTNRADEFVLSSRSTVESQLEKSPTGVLEDEPNFGFIPVGGTTSGAVDHGGDTDFYRVNLVAGQTYSFSLQGAGATPINDAFLVLYNPNGTFNRYDDDGGNELASLITFTATETGAYYLRASSFANAGDPGLGTYALDVRQQGADAVGNTNATAGTLSVGNSVFGFRETGTDVDRYAVTLEAGKYYTFQVAGGADYETDYLAVPTGELDTILRLRDAAGNLLAEGDDNNFPSDISSGVGFYAEVSGTYYLDVTAYPNQTGGYVLKSLEAVNPLDLNPLESLNWDTADNIDTVMVDGVPTAYLYFGAAGENFGTGETTYGWQQHQIDAVMHALQNQYTPITGINYAITTDSSVAEFRMITVENQTYGARFYPQDPGYGSLQGIGSFNLLSGGFGSDPNSLLPGGYSYEVILHEFGHAHGIAHPHDTGGDSDVMLGVTGADSLGIFDLNQGVYTVMSYNSGWVTHPDGTRNYSAANRTSGWNQTLGAFDIAVLQSRGYLSSPTNVGDTVYTIADTQAAANYQTIWDTGGIDTIAYVGIKDVQIDLLAATLDYTPTGGGVLSFAHNVWGGYTIANGVVIENATGSSGNDVLLGNSAANVLTGNDGNDTLMGRGGNDILLGGAGVDTVTGGDGIDVVTLGAGDDIFVAEVGATKIATKAGTMSVDIITDFDASGAGNDLIDLSGFDVAFNFDGTNANRDAGDLTYKTYASVNGAENALGFDIDGQAGASGVSGPVTVVYGNVNGGQADFAIVLLNTSNVSQDDFIYV